MQPLEIKVLEGWFTIHHLEKDKEIPEQVYNSSFYTISKTEDELSIVCGSAITVDAEKSESGWSCLKVIGPLDFSLTGILAGLSNILADAGISIFSISTYDTDYILVKSEALADATAVLSAAGHRIKRPPARGRLKSSRKHP